MFNFSLTSCQVRLRSLITATVDNFNVCAEQHYCVDWCAILHYWAGLYRDAAQCSGLHGGGPGGVRAGGHGRAHHASPGAQHRPQQCWSGDIVVAHLHCNCVSDSESQNVFKLVFSKNPLTTGTDYALSVTVQPVQLFYNEPVLSDLLSFLFLPHTDCTEVTWGIIYQARR